MHKKFKRILFVLISLVIFKTEAFSSSEEKLCGAVDYSWEMEGLTCALDYVVTLLEYVVLLCFSIAAVISVISALQIYIKMQTSEQGINKEIVMVLGGLLFIVFSAVVMPGFFGLVW